MPRTAAHLVETQWKPGQPSANPLGRPKGARSKLSTLTLELLLADFEIHGQAVIEKVRQKRPETYLSAVVSLLPKQQEKIESPFVDLTDAELQMLEDMLASMRAKTVKDLGPLDLTTQPQTLRGNIKKEPNSNPHPANNQGYTE